MPIEGRTTTEVAGGLRYGMVGGGRGAFIGGVHRQAIAMDGTASLVAACFSQDFANTLETGMSLGVPRDRLYRSYRAMILGEARRADPIDFLVIATPNRTHYAIARLALEHGIHVVCEKPLATSVADARALASLAKRKGLLFAVAYAYTGYPIVRHMREMVARGELGDIRFVAAEYPQEWLASPLERTGQKQAAWRSDPRQAGMSNCVGDIGSHIENMVSYLTGLEMESLCARLDTFGEGRILDDNASIMVNYRGGAKGLFWSSQIAVGTDNALRIRIYGSRGGVEWAQEECNYIRVSFIDKPTARISRGRDKLYPRAQALSRIPSGHPEGYFEAFANIYSTYLGAVAKKKAGLPLTREDLDFPDVKDGLRGTAFIEKCVESSKLGSQWVKFS